MKKKQLNNSLFLNKKTISSLETNSTSAIKGGQKPTYTGNSNACEPHSVVHTCNYSDLRTCAAETYQVCLTAICG